MSKTVWCLPETKKDDALQLEIALFQGVKSYVSSPAVAGGRYPDFVQIEGDTAVVSIGDMILTHRIEFWGKKFGVGSREWCEVVGRIREDDKIKNVILDIDSPGGDSFGSSEIAIAIELLNKKKPVHAYIRGTGCSGAYWIACAARTITAGSMSTVGSIGCYILMYDDSQRLKGFGIKPVMVRSGPLKGIGADGITDEQTSHLQEMVDSIADRFFLVVAESRKLSLDDTEDWGSGGFWTAEEALKKGLVDRILDWSTFLEQQLGTSKGVFGNDHINHSNFETTTEDEMSQSPKTPVQSGQAATIHELKSMFPKAGSDFYVAQLEQSATIDEATKSYIRHCEALITKLQAENTVLSARSENDQDDEEEKETKKTKSRKSKSQDDDEDEEEEEKKSKKSRSEDDEEEKSKSRSKKSKSQDDEDEDADSEEEKKESKGKSKASGGLGVFPVAGGYGKTNAKFQSVKDEWDAAVNTAKKDNPGLTNHEAVSLVMARNPGLHERFLEEANR